MKWTVTISDPLNETVLATVENGIDTSTDRVVMRGFDPPIVAPPGAGKSLNLYVKQSELEVPPRAIIQFSLDDTPVFWGPAVIVPPSGAPGAGPFDRDRDALERVTVLGGEQLLKDSIVGPIIFARDQFDPATIAYTTSLRYAHPALTVLEENFPLTGAALTVFYRPESTLADYLERLAETVPGGASFWVDASGAVHFEAISGGE